MQTPPEAGGPIYLQIMETIKGQIVSGARGAGDRIPTVRELAVTFCVNPNTVQRALTELEREGLLYTERTAGRFITTDEARIGQLCTEAVRTQVAQFLTRMGALGYSAAAAREQITAYMQQEEES